jgi:hypothetical protein
MYEAQQVFKYKWRLFPVSIVPPLQVCSYMKLMSNWLMADA